MGIPVLFPHGDVPRGRAALASLPIVLAAWQPAPLPVQRVRKVAAIAAAQSQPARRRPCDLATIIASWTDVQQPVQRRRRAVITVKVPKRRAIPPHILSPPAEQQPAQRVASVVESPPIDEYVPPRRRVPRVEDDPPPPTQRVASVVESPPIDEHVPPRRRVPRVEDDPPPPAQRVASVVESPPIDEYVPPRRRVPRVEDDPPPPTQRRRLLAPIITATIADEGGGGEDEPWLPGGDVVVLTEADLARLVGRPYLDPLRHDAIEWVPPSARDDDDDGSVVNRLHRRGAKAADEAAATPTQRGAAARASAVLATARLLYWFFKR